MKTTQKLSVNLVKCMAVAATIVVLSVGSAAAGSRSQKAMGHKAKGGLPECMDKLNAITANLETCETNYAQAQDENSLQQTDLDACYNDLDLIEDNLDLCEESEAPSSPVPGVPKTGQKEKDDTLPYGGDDGDLQKGVAWPDPRFTDNGDGTVTDNMTGLVWTKNANIFEVAQTWDTAVDKCNFLTDPGGDWRLPNVRELNSLVDYGQYYPVLPSGHPFLNVQLSPYWTSTTYAPNEYLSWGVSLDNGYNAPAYYKTIPYGFVWCVRDGQ